jgi:HSP20 family molecular chaperone IbpA
LYTVKNDKGAIEKQVLEVVYTPFAAKDVTVDVENGVLVIKIGNKKFKEKDADSMIYHGISS